MTSLTTLATLALQSPGCTMSASAVHYIPSLPFQILSLFLNQTSIISELGGLEILSDLLMSYVSIRCTLQPSSIILSD